MAFGCMGMVTATSRADGVKVSAVSWIVEYVSSWQFVPNAGVLRARWAGAGRRAKARAGRAGLAAAREVEGGAAAAPATWNCMMVRVLGP